MGIVAGLLNQNINKIFSVTVDEYSDTSTTLVYSDVNCRWQEKINKVVDSNGEEVTTTVDVWLDPDKTIEYDYQIKKDSEVYRVVAREYRYNLYGIKDHVRLWLA